jgi:D-tyrosyl-tRNA(Tyr) deacylase
MRVLIQRVSAASVTIDNTTKAAIDRGLLLFLGIAHDDSIDDINWLCNKILKMRIFNDSNQQMNLAVEDCSARILVVSQFTLHASTKKGNRPSFISAAPPVVAIPLYESFLNTLRTLSKVPVESGTFGADMKVSLVNDGPVTIWLDTQHKT